MTKLALLMADTAASTAGAAGGDSTALYWAFGLAGAAIVLFILELFIPTGGLLGLLCMTCVVASVVLFFRHDPSWGFLAIAGYCVAAPMALVFGLRMWSYSPIAKKLILGGPDDPELSDEEAMMADEHARRERLAALRTLIGVEGRAVTPLRPVGFVSIDGRRIDALAEGTIIDAGTLVVVIDVVDNQLKVRPREALV